MRGFHQELAHCALRERTGTVFWCDGDHGFDPYDFTERNLTRGFDATWGDDRVLVKRCMTPFQWATVLTQHLEAALHSTEAALVLAAPYDALFSTDELKDWEQEDYVAHSLRHLKGFARRFHIPVFLSVDMNRWWRTHPFLARRTSEAVDVTWSVRPSGDGWFAVRHHDQFALHPQARRQATLWDYAPPSTPTPPLRSFDPTPPLWGRLGPQR